MSLRLSNAVNYTTLHATPEEQDILAILPRLRHRADAMYDSLVRIHPRTSWTAPPGTVSPAWMRLT